MCPSAAAPCQGFIVRVVPMKVSGMRALGRQCMKISTRAALYFTIGGRLAAGAPVPGAQLQQPLQLGLESLTRSSCLPACSSAE